MPQIVSGAFGEPIRLYPGQIAELSLSFKNPNSDLWEFELFADADPALLLNLRDQKRRVQASGRTTFLIEVRAASTEVDPGEYDVVAVIKSHNMIQNPPGEVRSKVILLAAPPPDVEEDDPPPYTGGDIEKEPPDPPVEVPDAGIRDVSVEEPPKSAKGGSKVGDVAETKESAPAPKKAPTPEAPAAKSSDSAQAANEKPAPKAQVKTGSSGVGNKPPGAKAGGAGNADLDGKPPERKDATKVEYDLADGRSIELRPGESCLLHFEFRNTEKGTVIYDLNVELLDPKWYEIVQNQVNIRPGGKHYVSFLVKVPEHTQPKTQTFQVRVGPVQTGEDGVQRTEKRGTERRYKLRVLSTSAVAISTEFTEVVAKAKQKEIEFRILARNIGNASTAYRLAVREQRDEQGRKVLGPPIQQKDQWSYELDKELENSMLPPPTEPGEPVLHILRVRPTQPWYWGRKVSHPFTVVAEPVTDESNGSLAGNTLNLVATRKRWWLVPWVIAAPIGVVLLGLWLSGAGLSGLEVVNEIPTTNREGLAFIVPPAADNFHDTKGAASLPVELRWNSIPFLPKKIFINGESHWFFGNSATVMATVEANKYINPGVTVELASPFGFVRDSKRLVLLPHRTAQSLAYEFGGYSTQEDIDRAVKDGTLKVSQDLLVPGEKERRDTVDIVLNAAPDGTASLTLKNLSDGYQIYYKIARVPSGYSIYNVSADDDLQLQNRNAGEESSNHEIKFMPRTGANAPAKEEQALILTTDNNVPIIRVKIRRGS